MPIRVEYNPNPTLLSEAARRYGMSAGAEEQRRQQVQESQQAAAAALDRLNSDRGFQINQANVGLRDRELSQRDRLAQQAQDFAREQATTGERIDNRAAFRDARLARQNYEIQQRSELEGQIARDMSEIARRTEIEALSRMSPETQRTVQAARRRQAMIRLNPSIRPEHYPQLDAEIETEVQGAMAADRSAGPRWAEGQEPGAIWQDEHTGAVFSRDQDGNTRLMVRPDQTLEYMSAQEERARTQKREVAESRVFVDVFNQSLVENPGDTATAQRLAGQALRAYRAEAYQQPASAGVAATAPSAGPRLIDGAPTGFVDVDEGRQLGYVTTARGEEAVISLDVVRRTPADLTYWAAEIVGVPEGQEPTPAQEDAMVEVVRSLMGGSR